MTSLNTKAWATAFRWTVQLLTTKRRGGGRRRKWGPQGKPLPSQLRGRLNHERHESDLFSLLSK